MLEEEANGAMHDEYDFIVVGGGPGGYPIATLLARNGYRVALLEEDKVGGECTNYGCVPTKALAHYALTFNDSGRLGLNPSRDPYRALDLANSIAGEVSKGIESILDNAGVEVFREHGRVYPSYTVETSSRQLHGIKAVVLATGSIPFILPGVKVDGDRIHDNRTILKLEPVIGETFIIVGGGYIGIEYSIILSLLGYKVVIIEAMSRLLPFMDRDFSMLARRVLSKLGVKIYLSQGVEKIKKDKNKIIISTQDKIIRGDRTLIAIGRKPRIEEAVRAGLNLSPKGYVKVDKCGRAKGKFYVIGDLAGPPLLAHKAIHESIRSSLCIMNGTRANKMGAWVVPQVIYGPIEMVSVGLTLEDAARRNIKAVEVRVPAGGLARQRILGESSGFAKIVYEEKNGTILGVHMAYPGAAEVSSVASAMISMKTTIYDALDIVFPHPTSSEVLQEAILAANNLHVHVTGVRIRKTG